MKIFACYECNPYPCVLIVNGPGFLPRICPVASVKPEWRMVVLEAEKEV